MIPDVAGLRPFLDGLDYPARRLGATREVLRHLAALPNRTYEGPNAVDRALLDT